MTGPAESGAEAKLIPLNYLVLLCIKAEFAEEGTFFTNRFPSLRIFVSKKFEIKKMRPIL